jgi:hypothetical protein
MYLRVAVLCSQAALFSPRGSLSVVADVLEILGQVRLAQGRFSAEAETSVAAREPLVHPA